MLKPTKSIYFRVVVLEITLFIRCVVPSSNTIWMAQTKINKNGMFISYETKGNFSLRTSQLFWTADTATSILLPPSVVMSFKTVYDVFLFAHSRVVVVVIRANKGTSFLFSGHFPITLFAWRERESEQKDIDARKGSHLHERGCSNATLLWACTSLSLSVWTRS